MPYVVGIVLSLGVALFARRVEFDRDRALYPTVLIVIASYYVLFGRDERIGSHGALRINRDGGSLDCRRRRIQVGGRPFVSRMTSERQVALPGQ
jgi:hypothetical protein